MFTESRKIQLLEDVIKTTDEHTLVELETLVKKSKTSKPTKVSAREFLGSWTKKDAALIKAAIKEGCEQIHPDDWK